MNRFVLCGVAAFFAIVGLALLGADNKVVAGHGCHGCVGIGCDGGHHCGGGACFGGHHGRARCHGGLLQRHRCHGRTRCHGGLFQRHRCHGAACHGAADCCGVVVDACGCHGGGVIQKGKGYEDAAPEYAPEGPAPEAPVPDAPEAPEAPQASAAPVFQGLAFRS